MTTRVRGHFDGRVFVPDEPVDVPIGQPLEMLLRRVDVDAPSPSTSLNQVADWIESLPPVDDAPSPGDLAAQHDHYLYGTPKRP